MTVLMTMKNQTQLIVDGLEGVIKSSIFWETKSVKMVRFAVQATLMALQAAFSMPAPTLTTVHKTAGKPAARAPAPMSHGLGTP